MFRGARNKPRTRLIEPGNRSIGRVAQPAFMPPHTCQIERYHCI